MSDKSIIDEKRNNTDDDNKTSKKKEKFGTLKPEKKKINEYHRVEINQGFDDQNRGTFSNDEAFSEKHPMYSEDHETFGRVRKEPERNRIATISSDVINVSNQNSWIDSYSQQSLDNIVSTIGILKENTIENTVDTTTNDKFVEDGNGICDCKKKNCVCVSVDQSGTDIDESQTQDTNELLPHDFCTCHEINTPKNIHKDSRANLTNRYNYNQMRMGYDKSERKIDKKAHTKKEQVSNPDVSNEDSSTTIPQLYKARVKHLLNSGFIPERLTFNAVTGAYPGKLKYCPCITENGYNASSSVKHHVNFLPNVVDKKQQKGKKERKSILSKFRKNRKNSFLERNKLISHKNGKNNEHKIGNKACMRFDGNEYVSTKQLPDRIDIYCFDHLNTSYFRTSDQPPPLITDIAMEKTEAVATRFWAEIFGFVHVIICFFIAFLLQLYKFLLYSILRPVMVGLVQLTSDYFYKPLLTITYNGFTQPSLVFLFNVAASFRDFCAPVARGLGYFISEVAVLLRAIRLVDCSSNTPCQIKKVKDSYC